jgi:GGDEF domain-containing protein
VEPDRWRAFNNRFGQQAGDEVLRHFAHEIDRIPFARAVRDGGDEFLVVGAPRRTPLRADLDAFRKRWPVRFRERFGADVPPVAPRIVVRRARGRDLRSLRERLGKEITALKELGDCGEEGVLVEHDAGGA